MSLTEFSNNRVINLETYKKSGNPVQTPVWFVQDTGIIYVRTDPKTWKVKRIKNNPVVRIVPSNMSGKILGTWMKAEAHIVEREKATQMLQLFRKKYGMMGRIFDFFNRLRGKRLSTIISIKVV
jgi:uncharacterized protein